MSAVGRGIDTLYLHVGHGKTGSSYIQSVAARNIDALARHGIVYPEPPSFEAAAQGNISSGNGTMLLGSPEEVPALPEGFRAAFFSSEGLFKPMPERDRAATLFRTLERYGAERIEILLFIRDPMEHLASAYQQQVKRRGSVEEVEAAAEAFNFPAVVQRALRGLRERNTVNVTVRNYSRHKADLAAVLAGWLGLPPDALDRVAHPVNRSLSATELHIQRRINMTLGKSGRLAADPLCNTLPEIRSARVLPDLATQEALIARLRPAVSAVNRLIEPGEHYRLAVMEADPAPARPDLSHEQLDLVIDALAGEILRFRDLAARRQTALRKMRRQLERQGEQAADEES